MIIVSYGIHRWKRSVPISKWTSKVLNATTRVSACHQPPCVGISLFLCPTIYSEDYLYLNIFIPLLSDSSSTSRLSVMIFIAGGVLGFLATGTKPNDIKSNYDLLNQRLAIAWIKANIDAFGGDSKQITLFGQSAGAQPVALHHITSEMQSFFQANIVQSAPMAIPFR
ncbi:unnamed protein product [Rotaria sp. Silwood1]|nr:unnamed protein product [Rotaria sp. Silwood1]